jgi:hypothetical protein
MGSKTHTVLRLFPSFDTAFGLLTTNGMLLLVSITAVVPEEPVVAAATTTIGPE